MMQKRVLHALLPVAALYFAGHGSGTPYEFPPLPLFPVMPLSSDNPVTAEGAMLGRYLFYDPLLSADSTLFCGSCHHQASAFSDAPKAFSTGTTGAELRRNTMPLFNLAWYPAFFWDGRAGSIEQQVFHPVREADEMGLPWSEAAERVGRSAFYGPLFAEAFGNPEVDSVRIAKAIAQFLRTLLSYRSKYDRVLAGESYFTEDEYDGFVLVNDQTRGGCLHCHTTDGAVLGTNLAFSNNGLDPVSDPSDYRDKGRGAVTGKVTDNGKFMVPSLRNLAYTAPYMHDGRFKTLAEVMEFYSTGVQASANLDPKMGPTHHRGGAELTAEEKRKMIAFLLTLSDSAFVTDAAFSDPRPRRSRPTPFSDQ
jgi:cytochrome c peroxidase